MADGFYRRSLFGSECGGTLQAESDPFNAGSQRAKIWQRMFAINLFLESARPLYNGIAYIKYVRNRQEKKPAELHQHSSRICESPGVNRLAAESCEIRGTSSISPIDRSAHRSRRCKWVHSVGGEVKAHVVEEERRALPSNATVSGERVSTQSVPALQCLQRATENKEFGRRALFEEVRNSVQLPPLSVTGSDGKEFRNFKQQKTDAITNERVLQPSSVRASKFGQGERFPVPLKMSRVGGKIRPDVTATDAPGRCNRRYSIQPLVTARCSHPDHISLRCLSAKTRASVINGAGQGTPLEEIPGCMRQLMRTERRDEWRRCLSTDAAMRNRPRRSGCERLRDPANGTVPGSGCDGGSTPPPPHPSAVPGRTKLMLSPPPPEKDRKSLLILMDGSDWTRQRGVDGDLLRRVQRCHDHGPFNTSASPGVPGMERIVTGETTRDKNVNFYTSGNQHRPQTLSRPFGQAGGHGGHVFSFRHSWLNVMSLGKALKANFHQAAMIGRRPDSGLTTLPGRWETGNTQDMTNGGRDSTHVTRLRDL
ncbi:hypothetical protein Bbelb_375510 [Branchiostoma belcheri]|nr:hypothetical protein Bbelb_375510 [Branchiostoma belcheri]